ncbi:MAG TPA: hypothetical protein VIM98_11270 [Dyella sp.]|uniref:hypothetical protein n=1 Tax=Dyella sp. TaxID=1869338 RepID=UPI002F94E37B
MYFAFASSYQDYINAGNDTEKKKQVLVLMAMKCAAAPNIATSDAMRALLSGGIPTNWPSSQPNNSPAPASSVVTPPKPAQGIDLLVQPLAKPKQ